MTGLKNVVWLIIYFLNISRLRLIFLLIFIHNNVIRFTPKISNTKTIFKSIKIWIDLIKILVIFLFEIGIHTGNYYFVFYLVTV